MLFRIILKNPPIISDEFIAQRFIELKLEDKKLLYLRKLLFTLSNKYKNFDNLLLINNLKTKKNLMNFIDEIIAEDQRIYNDAQASILFLEILKKYIYQNNNNYEYIIENVKSIESKIQDIKNNINLSI